jgi:endonuclease III
MVKKISHTAVEKLLKSFGKKYSESLGIDLRGGREREIFRWFLASLLFGAPISESSAVKTYKCFEARGATKPDKIIAIGWQGLVELLDEGSYTRYDFKTADKLLEVMGNLIKGYGGSLTNLHERALNCEDLERRIKSLGKGTGDVTVRIFLRELREIWNKANPKPTELEILAARNLGITRSGDPAQALVDLKKFWIENRVKNHDFVDFEVALLRLGKDFCRKKRCVSCSMRDHCATEA